MTAEEQDEQFSGVGMVEADPERIELEELEQTTLAGSAVPNRALIERVQVQLTVELGRSKISVKDLRQLRQGQIVVLDQIVGEPLAVFANGHRVAVGEVVSVAKDQYGIRVTALASASASADETEHKDAPA
jgi:flagellar motor switch protein FliN/FliY